MRSEFAGLLLAVVVGLAQAQDIDRDRLPAEARDTLTLIERGGPFPYRRDGIVFNNFEKRLPPRPRGHYREYTVPTPGAKTRGARRLVCGGNRPQLPEVCYYSPDHYRSFRRVAP